MKTYLLITRNAIYIPSMENNLIPSFLMSEAGILLNDVASIHCGEYVSQNIHSIIVQEEDFDLHIPLRLDGILSYIPTGSLTPEYIENIDHVEAIFLTPDSTSWDTYNGAYEVEAEIFLDKKGGMIYPQ